MEDTTGFHFFADVTVYVDGFVYQHFDALPLTHVVQSRVIALRTVVESCTRVEAQGLPEVIFLRMQNCLQRGRRLVDFGKPLQVRRLIAVDIILRIRNFTEMLWPTDDKFLSRTLIVFNRETGGNLVFTATSERKSCHWRILLVDY